MIFFFFFYAPTVRRTSITEIRPWMRESYFRPLAHIFYSSSFHLFWQIFLHRPGTPTPMAQVTSALLSKTGCAYSRQTHHHPFFSPLFPSLILALWWLLTRALLLWGEVPFTRAQGPHFPSLLRLPFSILLPVSEPLFFAPF